MKKNTIGVIIATFNGEKFIQEQLESIISQTIKPDLMVVSDGGSIDSTIEICQAVLKKSGIEYVILQSDKQLSVKENFEKGLRKCKTDYIFFSDQDDYWLPNKIKNTIQVMDDTGSVLVFCNAYITDESLRAGKHTLWQQIGYEPKKTVTVYDRLDGDLQKELIRRNIITGMCMAIDVRILKDILPFSDNTIHDSWIALVANTQGKVASINSCDVYYRQHDYNAIGTKSTIKGSYNHRGEYLNKVKRRFRLIEEIKAKAYNYDSNYTKRYDIYMDYLKSRIDYIEKKRKMPDFKHYQKYERKPMMIMLKDIYARINQ